MADQPFLASNSFDGDGTTTDWEFSWEGLSPDAAPGAVPYISVEDIHCEEMTPDGEDQVVVQKDFILLTPTKVRVTPATPVGTTLRVYRVTENRFPLVDYNNLQTVSEADLDLANRQCVYITQEARDAARGSGNIQAEAIAIAQGAAVEAAESAAEAEVTAAAAAASAAAAAASLAALNGPTGAASVGWQRAPLTDAITTVNRMLNAQWVNIWEYAALVTVKPTPSNPSTWDWTPAIQAAHNAYAMVYYPVGNEYQHASTISLTLFGSAIVSTPNKYSSAVLRYTGSATAWSCAGSVNYLQLIGARITGTPAVSTDYYNTGSKAFDTTAGATSVVWENAWVTNFETLLNSNFNSFYNRLYGCRLEKFRNGLLNVSTNNLIVDSCRVLGFNKFIRTAGSGPITITNSSFEQFNGAIVESPNLKIGVNFKNNYVETLDSTDIPTNFPPNTLGNPAKFGGNILFSGLFGTLAIQGNELQIPGSRRIGAFEECDVLSSRGNSISIYSTGNNIDRLYTSTNPIKHVDICDRLGATFGAGPYAITYIQTAISGTVDGDYYFFDCILNRVFANPTLIVTPTLLNSWTAPDVFHGNPRLIKDGTKLRLSGMIDGTASTAQQVFTVPANLRPYEYGTTREYANFSLFANSGAGNIIRFRYFYATGVFQLEGAPVNKNLIPLDGIVIPERH